MGFDVVLWGRPLTPADPGRVRPGPGPDDLAEHPIGRDLPLGPSRPRQVDGRPRSPDEPRLDATGRLAGGKPLPVGRAGCAYRRNRRSSCTGRSIDRAPRSRRIRLPTTEGASMGMTLFRRGAMLSCAAAWRLRRRRWPRTGRPTRSSPRSTRSRCRRSPRTAPIARRSRIHRQAQKAMEQKADLIGELYKAHPDSPELVKLMPERWQSAMMPGPEADETKAEIDEVLAKSKNEKLVAEAAFIKVADGLPEGRPANAKPEDLMPAIEEFVEAIPQGPPGRDDPRGPRQQGRPTRPRRPSSSSGSRRTIPTARAVKALAGERRAARGGRQAVRASSSPTRSRGPRSRWPA